MKIAKTILGLFLLYGTASEYLSASRQFGSFINPGIIIITLAIIGVCTWLIGSGMSQQKLTIKSLPFLKYLCISVGLFIFFGIMSVPRYLPTKEIIEINGLRGYWQMHEGE